MTDCPGRDNQAMSFRQPLAPVQQPNSSASFSTPTTTIPAPPASAHMIKQEDARAMDGHMSVKVEEDMRERISSKTESRKSSLPTPSPLLAKTNAPSAHVTQTPGPPRDRDYYHSSRSVRTITSGSVRDRQRQDENSSAYLHYPASIGREPSYPPRHGSSSYMHRHAHPQPRPHPPPRFSPYAYSPTPSLAYSHYDPMSPHPSTAVLHGRFPKPSHGGHPSQAHASAHHHMTMTPTPSSRSYRTHTTGTPSYGSAGSATPMSVHTPLAYPMSPTSTSGEYIMLPRMHHSSSSLQLHGLEPAAQWQEDCPPHLWLAGEQGDVPPPPQMCKAQEKEWKKLVAFTKNFKSHNPWDYGIKENREHFNDNHKKYLETLWILDSNPSTTARERLGAWLGVASRRITVFYQNRRQMMAKTKQCRPSSAAPSRRASDASNDGGVFGEMLVGAKPPGSSRHSTPRHGHGTLGPIRLNPSRGVLDENWKWTPVSGPLPMPDPAMIEKLAVVQAIIMGELDRYCYYHLFMTDRLHHSSYTASPSLETTSVSDESAYEFGPAQPYPHPHPHAHAHVHHRLEDILHEREAELPIRKRSPPEPMYDDGGSVVNLAAMLPTDPPSEDFGPVDSQTGEVDRRRPTSRAHRGERYPDFAMRHETSIASARASAMTLVRSSSRAKLLARRPSSSSAQSVSPFHRSQSLPSLAQGLVLPPPIPSLSSQPPPLAPLSHSSSSRPKMPERKVAARQSYPSITTSRPIVHTRPVNSWARSHSAMELPGGSRSRAVSPGETEIAEEDEGEQQDGVKRPAAPITAELSEAAELLMGMSRCTDSSGSSQ